MRISRIVAVIVTTSPVAIAQQQYTLLSGSRMDRELCLSPCACPYHEFHGPLTGGFVLSFLDSNPPLTRYRLSSIQWHADFGQTSEDMSGTGIYTISSAAAPTHRLQLDLTIGPLTMITEFDSGFVPVDPQNPFPRLSITTIAEPTCRREVITILAAPECYANCDGSTGNPVLTSNDFQCFINKFAANNAYANCDGSTGNPQLTANDFQCFINTFAGGCS